MVSTFLQHSSSIDIELFSFLVCLFTGIQFLLCLQGRCIDLTLRTKSWSPSNPQMNNWFMEWKPKMGHDITLPCLFLFLFLLIFCSLSFLTSLSLSPNSSLFVFGINLENLKPNNKTNIVLCRLITNLMLFQVAKHKNVCCEIVTKCRPSSVLTTHCFGWRGNEMPAVDLKRQSKCWLSSVVWK